MAHLLTLIAENIFVVIAFALYGVLVYYMVSKALQKRYGKKHGKKNSKSDSSSRKNFSKHVVTANKLSGNDFSN